MSNRNNQQGNHVHAAVLPEWGMDAKWLKDQLARDGYSQAGLAKALGKGQPTINKMVQGKRRILASEVPAILRYLGLSEAPQLSTLPKNEVRAADAGLRVPLLSEMAEDVPVLGTALGGESGDFTMNGDSGLRVRRPPRLIGRDDIFALFVQGESVSPAYDAGELIYVERRRPPQNGDYVVVELHPEGDGGDYPALLKLLVAITPTKVRLEQHNPKRTFDVDRKRVRQILRVMTLQDLLGI
jgi:phage repressor protein C with HTH and peptisase S24 domain